MSSTGQKLKFLEERELRKGPADILHSVPYFGEIHQFNPPPSRSMYFPSQSRNITPPKSSLKIRFLSLHGFLLFFTQSLLVLISASVENVPQLYLLVMTRMRQIVLSQHCFALSKHSSFLPLGGSSEDSPPETEQGRRLHI